MGIHVVKAAIEHDPGHVHEVLVEVGASNPRLQALVDQTHRLDVPVRYVATQALNGIAGSLRHQGVAASYRATAFHLEADLPKLLSATTEPPLLVILDGIQDPHNLGACMRSAAAAGVTAVILPKYQSSSVTATVRKVSAGAVDTIPIVVVANLARCLRMLKDYGVWIYGLESQAQAVFYDQDFRGPVAFVLGGEANGLRRLTRDNCDLHVQIPLSGLIDCLNVSVACGVTVFEARRQRLGHRSGSQTSPLV